jgi:CheY-like chemotaxis protein
VSHFDRRGRRSQYNRRATRSAITRHDASHRHILATVRVSPAATERAGTGNRARILVIEHDPRTRETLALILQSYGYDVTLTGDGREATRLLAHMTPDLVVMEWWTPGLSGFALCLALRRRWPMMPIVVVTSHNEVFDGDRPVNAWLQKPIDAPTLKQAIHDELAPICSS